MPGRKTDVKDAEGLADLWNIPNVPSRDCNMGWCAGALAHPPCHLGDIPAEPQRELRDWTRPRANFIRERATVVNRVQKVLEGANIKLGSVASNVMGVSGRAILDAWVEGQSDPATLAELAKGQLRTKRAALTKALQGRMKPHQRFVLTELLCQIDNLDETIAHFDEQIKTYGAPSQKNWDSQFEEAVTRLDTIPGVGRATAELIVAEIGINMSQFPSARPLCAWAGVAPGNNESAGKRRSSQTRQGDRALRVGLVQAAQAAAHTRKTYLSAQYHRLAARRGRKRAIMAVAHSILVIAYHLILRHENYKELGANYFDQLNPEGTAKRLVKRLEKLGYQVALLPEPVTATA